MSLKQNRIGCYVEFPLVFPGVVIGFFVIMSEGDKVLFANWGSLLVGERWNAWLIPFLASLLAI